MGEQSDGDPIEEAKQDCDSGHQYFKLKQSKADWEHKDEDHLYDHKTLMEFVIISDTKVT